MSKYSDPENIKDIMESLKTMPTIGDIKILIDKTFPNWIITTVTKYSSDYPHLTMNWSKITKKTKVIPTEIIIVEEMSFDDNHTLLGVFADILSQSGFSVRAKTDYIPCGVCNAAIPSPIIHSQFKNLGIKCPTTWAPKCSSC